jgi:nucleotide-binding universal stress UspA family protein
MFSKILVPLDGSVWAESVLGQVEELARMTGGEVLLLQVTPSPAPPDPEEPDNQPTVVERAEGYLNHVAERFRRHGLTASVHVRCGHAVQEILDHAAHYADLLVLCSHGGSGLKLWALGSVADKVTRHSLIPVLLFRQEG